MKQKIEKWQKHIKETVEEILDIGDRNYAFEKQREIIKSNSKLKESNIFITYLFKNYAEAQILAILRIVEDNGQTKSFVTLLNDLLLNFQEVINSGKLKEKNIENVNKKYTDEMLKKHFVNEISNNQFSWEKINSDKFDLLKQTAKLKNFRDKWIAHNDRKKSQMSITYNELGKIIEFLNLKVREYDLFLTSSSINQSHTLNLESDLEIFNFAWAK